MPPTDLIGVVEAAYRSDVTDDEWLHGLTHEARGVFDRGLGVAAYTYEVTAANEPLITRVSLAGDFDPAWIQRFQQRMGEDTEVVARPPTHWKTWLHIPCGTASKVAGLERLTSALVEFGGARDLLSINGRDPRGFGLWLGVPLRRATQLSKAKLELYTRVAAHFGAGHRVRRTRAGRALSADQAEAVMSPSGKVLHASGEARHRAAREELGRATVRMDRARSQQGRKDADRATSHWKGLVDARWSLLETIDSDGQRLILATENEVALSAPAPLSAREQQVLAFAAMDHTNKEIAYEMGLSASTVRVLMARAAKKLGAKGRSTALAKYRGGLKA